MEDEVKLTIEYQGQKVTIEKGDVIFIYDFVEIFKPALLALGFHIDSINKIFNEEYDE